MLNKMSAFDGSMNCDDKPLVKGAIPSEENLGTIKISDKLTLHLERV